MKIFNFIVTLLLFITFSSAQNNTFTMEGWTKDIADGTMLYLHDNAGVRVDSFEIKNDHFQFSGEVTSPFDEYSIFFLKEEGYDACTFFVETGKMTFDARERDFMNAKITGSKLQSEKDEFFSLTYPLMKEQMALREQFRTTDTEDQKEIQAQIQEIQQKDTEITRAFIETHPNYYVSVLALWFLKNRAYPKAELQELYNGLNKEMKATDIAQGIKAFLEQSVDLAIGNQAPDFQLPNLENEPIKLSNFKGKYVLLEFGASGCGPCRMENPNLLKAYQKYQEKGFEILSVWLDTSHQQWTKTVEKDQMIWTSVSDLKGHHGAVPNTYKVYGIPDNYLLDPEGKIIALDLRGEALQKELEKLLASN
ncbi:MAG: TlpA disulfide reductase family protein [Bacteroidota bacterium]